MGMCADDQYIWMGVYEKGLYRFSRSTHIFKHYDLSALSKVYTANQVSSVQRDDEGNIWILGNVLLVLNTRNDSLTTIDDVFGSSSVVFDGDTAWIGSSYAGLYKLDRKKHTVLAHYDEGSEDLPFSFFGAPYIHKDSARNLWLSTYSGLFKLDLETSELLSYADRRELADNRVVSIVEDAQGCLWMGTYKGLYKYTPWDDSFIHIAGMENWKNAQFNYHACAWDSMFIYMGFTKGLVYFNPSEICQHPKDNPVCFQALEFLDHPEESFHWHDKGGKTITLPYNRNFFTIRFSTAEMLVPEEIQYTCHMEGFEQNWQDLGNKQQVSYTNVPPGEYVFHVKSSDRSGRWNTEAAILRLIITPPWWQTGWAWCLWTLLIAGALFSAFLFSPFCLQADSICTFCPLALLIGSLRMSICDSGIRSLKRVT